MDESDGSRSTKESSRSSNSHSSRRNQQIAAAANYLAQQQVASNTAANANIRYQEQLPGKSGGQSSKPRTRRPAAMQELQEHQAHHQVLHVYQVLRTQLRQVV